MTLKSFLFAAGWVLDCLGLVAQFVAILAANSYSLRRRLPFESPFKLLIGIGCYLMMFGTALMIASWAIND